MSNQIQVTVVIDDKGSLQQVTQKATKAATGVTKLGNAASTADRQLKGAARASSNSTKNFSKMSQGITSGLVPAYATLAANIFAISAAFNAMRKAAAFDQLNAGLIEVGTNAGRNLPKVAESLVAITDNAISAKEAMSSVALGTSAGFSTAQLEGLTKVAKGASLALGRDLADAMSRLTRGAAKLEPEILDELGIMVRVDDATEAYARTLGKTREELTQFERRMAFTNAIIAQGTEKFGEIADSVEVNPYDKLAATFENLTQDIFSFINKGLKPLISILAENPGVLMGALVAFGTTIMRTILPQVSSMGAEAAASAAQAANAVVASNKRMEASRNARLKKEAKELPSFALASKTVKAQESLFKSGKAQAAEYSKAIKNTAKSIKMRKAALTDLAIANRGWEEDFVKGKRRELAEVERLHQSLIKLQATAAKRVAVKTGTVARGQAFTKTIGAKGLQAMEGAGAIQSFKLATKYSKIATKSIGHTTGALGKLRVGFGVAATSARLFGAALLNAVPVIGTIISLGFMAYEALNAMFPELFAKKVDKFAESFENFGDISSKLGKSQRTAKTATDAFTSSLRISVGVIDQIESGLLSINDVEFDKATKNVKDLTAELEELKKLAKGEESEASKWWYVFFPDTVIQQLAENTVAGLESQNGKLTKAKEEQEKILQDTSKYPEFINRAIKELESDSNLAKSPFLQQYIVELNNLKDSIGDFKNRDELEQRITSISEKFRTADSALQGAKDSANGLKDAISSFVKKTAGPLDGIIEQYENIQSQIKAMEKLGTPGGVQAFIEGLGPEFKLTAKEIPGVIARLKDINNSMVFSREQAKGLRLEAATYRKEMKYSAEAATKYYELNNQAVRLELDALEKEKEFLIERGASAVSILAIKNKQETLQQKIISNRDIEIAQLTAIYSLEKSRIDLESKERALKLDQKYSGVDTRGPISSEAFEEQQTIDKSYLAYENQLDVIYKKQLDISKLNQDDPRIPNLQREIELEQQKAEHLFQTYEITKQQFSDISKIQKTVESGLESGFQSAFDGIIQGTMSVKQAFANMAISILQDLSKVIAKMMVMKLLESSGGSFLGFLGFRDGGIASPPQARTGGIFDSGSKVQGYASGGVASGSTSGYPAILHGKEAIVPLPNGNAIPVEMRGGSTSNVAITVNMADGQGSTQTQQNNGEQGVQLGKLLAKAVQEELQKQKRPGGILSPYGAA